MAWLALLVAAAVTLLVARPLLAALPTRRNYRDAELPFPSGVVALAASALSLVLIAPLHELVDGDVIRPELRSVAIYALGVTALGLVDDVFSGPSRGWRGHFGALLRGEAVSTGVLKAAGSLGLALYAMSDLGLGDGEYLLAVAVLVLATNLFNLLDLRPGRAWKCFLLLGAGLLVGEWDAAPLQALGLFAGPAIVLGLHDLRERAMLGDTGSNLLGALAGLWLVLALGTTGQLVALAALVAVTLLGEFRSLTDLIARTPPLRRLDELGRP